MKKLYLSTFFLICSAWVFAAKSVYLGRIYDNGIYLQDDKYAALKNDSLLATIRTSIQYQAQTNLILMISVALLALLLLGQIWLIFFKKKPPEQITKPSRPAKREEEAPPPQQKPFKWEDK